MATKGKSHQETAEREKTHPTASSDGVAASRRLKRPPAMTPAQWDLLRDVVSGKRRTCHENYKPYIALWGAKLIHAFQAEHGQVDLRPTDAGIALVQQYQGTTP